MPVVWERAACLGSTRVFNYFYLCLLVVACCSEVTTVESRHVERRSGVEEMIAGLRSKAQHTHAADGNVAESEGGGARRQGPLRANLLSEDPQQRRKRGLPPVLPPANGDVDGKNFDGPYPRPSTERNAGTPCTMQGLIVRREMGNTGVTAFQVLDFALRVSRSANSTRTNSTRWVQQLRHSSRSLSPIVTLPHVSSQGLHLSLVSRASRSRAHAHAEYGDASFGRSLWPGCCSTRSALRGATTTTGSTWRACW